MRHPRLVRIRRAALALLLLTAPAVILAIPRGPDAGGYTATDETVYSFVDISGASGGTSILADTDDGAAALTLPFTFQFYGHPYSLVCVSSNGAIYFTTSAGFCSGIVDFANTGLMTTSTPGDTPALLPFWSDLSFQVPGAGAVFYQTLGAEEGTRKFILQWNNAYPDGSPNPVTFQAILSQGSNNVLFQYKTVTLGSGNPAGRGAQATIGIRDAGALLNHQQIEWSSNVPVLDDSTALLFSTASRAPVVPVIVVTGGSFIYNGYPHPATATATGTGGAAVAGSFSFSYSPGGAAAPVNGGVYGVTATFTSADPGYTNGSNTGSITINRATPTITWANPSDISEGTALSGTQLNATINAPATPAYTPPAGTLLNAGAVTLSVTFTPSNPANYYSATKTVTINVLPTRGEMEGSGRTEVSNVRYDFDFKVKERASGDERGKLKLDVTRTGRGGGPIGTFVTTSLNQVVFQDNPLFAPARRPRPTIDTATFSGVGRWNGTAGYTFTAQATDAGEPGRGRDLFTIAIKSPLGVVVATVNGTITAGNIQSNRLGR